MVISVITPVWNHSDLTNKFLFQHWQLYRNRIDIEFVIIDNGSIDNTPRLLKSWQEMMGKHLHVIVNEENRGFGPANNQGAELAKGDIFVFLSNDVIIGGDYLTSIQETITPNALIGPQIMDWDTGWNRFGDTLVSYVAGWCVCATRETWLELGGFDERYIPCDYEDMDVSLQAVKNGYELRRIDLPLAHLFGQSAQNLNGGREAVTLKNQELFKQKWGFV